MLLLFFIGLLLSPMSTYIFHGIGFPIVLPELIFIPILFYKYKYLGISFVRKPAFSLSIIATVLLILFSFITQDISIVAAISTARSFLIVFVFYDIGLKIRFDENFIRVCLIISLGSIIGWSLNNYLTIATGAYLKGNGILYGNMIAIPLCFASSLLFMSNYWIFALAFLDNIYLSMTSGLRRQILVSAISALLSMLFATVSGFSFKKQVVSIAIVAGLVVALPYMGSYLLDNNELLYNRVVLRTINLTEGVSNEGDDTRSSNSTKFIDEADQLIIPHGFVSFQTDKGGKGVFVDSPTYMLAYTFGLIPFLFYMLYYLARLGRCFIKAFLKRSKEYGFIFITSSVVFILHFVESSMFSFSFTAPMTGICIGLLFRRDIIKTINNVF